MLILHTNLTVRHLERGGIRSVATCSNVGNGKLPTACAGPEGQSYNDLGSAVRFTRLLVLHGTSM